MEVLDTIGVVVIATLLGAAIGAEREWRRHPGGLRSAAMVAAAASVFSQIAVLHAGGSQGAALGAIVTGVGFLGAGVIIHEGVHVRGLSTAATFWVTAAIGTATGVREFVLAGALTAVVLFSHVALRPFSAWIERKAPPESGQ